MAKYEIYINEVKESNRIMRVDDFSDNQLDNIYRRLQGKEHIYRIIVYDTSIGLDVYTAYF